MRKKIVLVVAAAVVVVAVALVVHSMLSAFEMHGQIVNSTCVGEPKVGEQVTVYDSSGVSVGATPLRPSDLNYAHVCVYQWTIPGIPRGSNTYSIRIGEVLQPITISGDTASEPKLYIR